MNIRHFAFFAAAATLSLAASAEPGIPSSADIAPPDALRVDRSVRLTRDEAQHMRGTFRLQDGRELVVTSANTRLFAKLDGKTEELVPVASQAFMTRDSHIRLAFDRVPFADEVTVTPAAQ